MGLATTDGENLRSKTLLGPAGMQALALVCQDDVTSSEEFGVFSHFWSVASYALGFLILL